MRRWAFFSHPPLLARLSLNLSRSPTSSRSTANREDLFPIGGPIVPFFFTSFAFENWRHDFSLLVPAPPPSLATASTRPLPSPSFFRRLAAPPLSSSLFLLGLGRTSLARPSARRLRTIGEASGSSFYLTCGVGKVGQAVQVGSRRKRNRRRVDFRSANVVSLLMNFSVR